MHNIIICLTPMHILIANKIIDRKKKDSFDFIYLPDQDTDQHQYYFERISKKVDNSYYIPITKKIYKDIWKILNIAHKLRTKNKPNFIVGNLKSIYSRLPMMLIGYSNIDTFDDGFANLLNNSFLDMPEKKYFKYFFKAFYPSLEYEKIKLNTHHHYSIFGERNNSNYIQLFNFNTNNMKLTSSKQILLTAPFSEYSMLNEKEEIDLYLRVISQFNITDILMHPNEKKQKLNKVHIIQSELIAEEYIDLLSKKYKITVYAFYSTALINLLSNKNINIINLHSPKMHNKNNKDIFKSLNIKVIDV